MKRMICSSWTVVAAIVALGQAPAIAETLVLDKSFVATYQDKATISVSFEVDEHPQAPHSQKSDGDMHIAGRASEVGLPLVAEIVNARSKENKGALDLVKQTASGRTVRVAGAWRIWFEHLGKVDMVQFDKVEVPTTTNPAHLFEIHPITDFADQNLRQASFQPIPGYQAYDAAKAFAFYEGVDATVEGSKSAIMLESGTGRYNYAEFFIEPTGAPQKVGDGLLVLAEVYVAADSEEAITAQPRRMVFVSGTAPAKAIAALPEGERLHVLGIPRVNLAEVAALAADHVDDPVQVKLPYEMIVVAVLPPDAASGAAEPAAAAPAEVPPPR